MALVVYSPRPSSFPFSSLPAELQVTIVKHAVEPFDIVYNPYFRTRLSTSITTRLREMMTVCRIFEWAIKGLLKERFSGRFIIKYVADINNVVPEVFQTPILRGYAKRIKILSLHNPHMAVEYLNAIRQHSSIVLPRIETVSLGMCTHFLRLRKFLAIGARMYDECAVNYVREFKDDLEHDPDDKRRAFPVVFPKARLIIALIFNNGTNAFVAIIDVLKDEVLGWKDLASTEDGTYTPAQWCQHRDEVLF